MAILFVLVTPVIVEPLRRVIGPRISEKPLLDARRLLGEKFLGVRFGVRLLGVRSRLLGDTRLWYMHQGFITCQNGQYKIEHIH